MKKKSIYLVEYLKPYLNFFVYFGKFLNLSAFSFFSLFSFLHHMSQYLGLHHQQYHVIRYKVQGSSPGKK